jgi:hypothetical protein
MYVCQQQQQQEEPAEVLGGEGEVMLKRALAQPRFRRWIGYEFHCSAIDRPYFMRSELGELLQVRVAGGEVVVGPGVVLGGFHSIRGMKHTSAMVGMCSWQLWNANAVTRGNGGAVCSGC